MAPLKDAQLYAAYRNALKNRGFVGYVNWTEVALRWIRGALDCPTADEIGEAMYEHVSAGGEIDQVPERRPEWVEHDFHYDLRIGIGGRRLYIESRLMFDDPADPDDPTILIANVHDA